MPESGRGEVVADRVGKEPCDFAKVFGASLLATRLRSSPLHSNMRFQLVNLTALRNLKSHTSGSRCSCAKLVSQSVSAKCHDVDPPIPSCGSLGTCRGERFMPVIGAHHRRLSA